MEVVYKLNENSDEEGGQQHGETFAVEAVKLSAILADMMESCNDIIGAMVSSTDGLPCAEKFQEGFDKHRFSAMSSALLALSDNLMKEAHHGSARNVLIESEDGNIFVMHAGTRLLLTVFTGPLSNLGMSLAHAKKASEDIAAA